MLRDSFTYYMNYHLRLVWYPHKKSYRQATPVFFEYLWYFYISIFSNRRFIVLAFCRAITCGIFTFYYIHYVKVYLFLCKGFSSLSVEVFLPVFFVLFSCNAFRCSYISWQKRARIYFLLERLVATSAISNVERASSAGYFMLSLLPIGSNSRPS